MYNNEPYSHSTAQGEINPQRYNPQEYTYVNGLGFTPLPAVARERHALRRSANSIGIAFIGYLVLSTLLPSLMAALVTASSARVCSTPPWTAPWGLRSCANTGITAVAQPSPSSVVSTCMNRGNPAQVLRNCLILS